MEGNLLILDLHSIWPNTKENPISAIFPTPLITVEALSLENFISAQLS